jgi:hypothetical protein
MVGACASRMADGCFLPLLCLWSCLVAVMCSPAFCDCRGREHPERPARLTAIMKQLRDTGVLARCQQVPGREASVEELVAVHDPHLVREVQAASLRAAGIRTPAHHKDTTSADQAAGATSGAGQPLDGGPAPPAVDAEMCDQLDALLGGAFLPERVTTRWEVLWW